MLIIQRILGLYWIYLVLVYMCKFETVYLIYKSMSSVLTPQVFLKPQTSPPPSVPSVIMVFSPQRWGSSLLQVSNSCTHGFYPLSCILSSQVLTRTKVRILQLKMLLIPKWPVFTIATYDFHWPSLKNMSFPTCRISIWGPPETPWFDTWYFDPKKIRCLKMGPQK